MSVKLQRKLSTKTITGLTVAQLREHASKVPNKPLYTIMGIATGKKAGESANGPWEALTGNFLAINHKGEKLRSGTLFMEKAAHELVSAALDVNESVEFGFNVMIREDESAATGYVYSAETIVEPTEDDPLEKMLASIDTKRLAAIPAIEAPKDNAENSGAEGDGKKGGKK